LIDKRKVRCPECGAEMNFHAEKIDFSRVLSEFAPADPELGGVLVEIHTCPVCRFVLERPGD
jgi:ssDNA-binding Zn-finger/Zn-ribbon topoisomerase 1